MAIDEAALASAVLNSQTTACIHEDMYVKSSNHTSWTYQKMSF